MMFALGVFAVLGVLLLFAWWQNKHGATAEQMVREKAIQFTEQVDKRTPLSRVFTVIVTHPNDSVEEFWMRVIFNSKWAKWLGRVAFTWGHDVRSYWTSIVAKVLAEEFSHMREMICRGRRLPQSLHYLDFLVVYAGDWVQFTYTKMREEKRSKRWAELNAGFFHDITALAA
jgi:hypothetical protein